MTENERVKEIRKALGLTMEKFGERLGVSKAAISRIESGENGVTPQMELLICREYNINESWLRTGEGDMTAPDPEDEIDAVMQKYSLPEEVRVMLEQFVALPPDHQTVIADYIDKVGSSLRGDEPAAQPSDQDSDTDTRTPAEKQLDEDYAREKANRKAAATSSGSVSTTA